MHNSSDLIVRDRNGIPIPGLFKKKDGSFVNRDITAFEKAQLQNSAFTSLNNEVAELKEQIKTILEYINGKS